MKYKLENLKERDKFGVVCVDDTEVFKFNVRKINFDCVERPERNLGRHFKHYDIINNY
jgi:hypothetical protein